MTVQVLTAYVVSTDPKISVIPDFLSPAECEHLITVSGRAGFERSLVGRGAYATNAVDKSEGFVNQFSDNRTSLSVMLAAAVDDVVAGIELRLAGLVQLPVEQLEQLVVVKYEPGQYFNVHHDGIFRPVTVFIYLNDLPENGGGETHFPELGIRVSPKAGTAVVWKNSSFDPITQSLLQDDRLRHAGLVTKHCTKYGINCFFNYNEMRTS